MSLFNKEIMDELHKQFKFSSSLEQNVITRIFDPGSNWQWYIMNADPNDGDYLWGIVYGFEVEIGSISKSELESLTNRFGLPLERDLHFKKRRAQEIWQSLLQKHREL